MSLAAIGVAPDAVSASRCMLSRITKKPAAMPRTAPSAETNSPIDRSAPGATLSARVTPHTHDSATTTALSVAIAPVARRICPSDISTYAPPKANNARLITNASVPEMSAVPLKSCVDVSHHVE
jgi:hypothetical protein